MKLYIMKKGALETLKENLPQIYGKYYTEPTNKWITELCGEDPFIEFKDVPDFKLADLDSDLTPGEIDLNNCKILYEKLLFLSESQASDERLWAGLCHSTFYEYMRKRWKYGYGGKPKSADKEAGAIQTRFFYRSSGRGGFYRNTLAKCWWVGHNVYDPKNATNHFESLDIIGSNDLNSKINEYFHNFTFSSNPDIMNAIVEALRKFNEEGKKLLVREHIRPAMSYLNAVGGSVVIDCLSKEEISDIFSDAITAIMQGDTPSLNLNNYSKENQEDVDYFDEGNNDSTDDVPSVTLGCMITIRNEAQEIKRYKYDYNNGKWIDLLNIYTGHKVGEFVELKGEQWKIEDISL